MSVSNHMNNKELVEKLKKQHENLTKMVQECLDEASKSDPDYIRIFQDLQKFNRELAEHLELENNIFYPELLEYIGAKGLNTSGMEKFISMMMDIQKTVMDFSAKYDSEKMIRESKDGFVQDLGEMGSILSIRMESENDCAYAYLE